MAGDIVKYNQDTDVSLSIGDVTDKDVDALVLPEFTSFASWDGVGRAVDYKGGTAALEAYDAYTKQHGRQKLGSVIPTGAGEMKLKAIFHAVSVINGNDPEYPRAKEIQYGVVRDAFYNAVKLAEQKGYSKIAAPLMGTGLMGTLTPRQSIEAMLSALADHYKEGGKRIKADFVIWSGDRNAKATFDEVWSVIQSGSFMRADRNQRAQGDVASDEEIDSRNDYVRSRLHGPRIDNS